MKNTKRIVTGLAFAATLALSLLAGGGDAYARTKGGGGQTHNSGGITITLPTPAAETFREVGITWE